MSGILRRIGHRLAWNVALILFFMSARFVERWGMAAGHGVGVLVVLAFFVAAPFVFRWLMRRRRAV